MGQHLRTLLLEHGLAALEFSLEYDLDIMSMRTQRISPSLLDFHKFGESGRAKGNIAEDQPLQVAEACLGWARGSSHGPTQKALDVVIDTSDAPQFEGLDAVHISNSTTYSFEPGPVLWVGVLREPKR